MLFILAKRVGYGQDFIVERMFVKARVFSSERISDRVRLVFHYIFVLVIGSRVLFYKGETGLKSLYEAKFFIVSLERSLKMVL